MPFTFRLLQLESDIELLHCWHNQPHVAETWNGTRTRDEILSEFSDDEHDQVASMRRYIVESDATPIGYMQCYRTAKCGNGWWLSERNPGTIGIDFFIGSADGIGRGIGSAMLSAAAEFFFADASITDIVADPAVDNLRSIACLQKSGFQSQGEIDTPDGKAQLMRLTRAR